MKFGKLSEITGKTIKSWYEWLDKEGDGCSSLCFESDDRYNYAVCMGWHNLGDGPKETNYNHWVIAWKIGRQTHNNIMQCDFDVDFEMPRDPDGDLDDTLQAVEFPETADMAEWDAMASEMRSEAERIWDTRKETADDSD